MCNEKVGGFKKEQYVVGVKERVKGLKKDEVR
ncbi:ribosomal L7Ae/L30e/S12e/Gadd45 family protein [Staphylococcus epidermidis]